jgi:NADPH:quinone reductase-like Zn-dependent oxidoreductase
MQSASILARTSSPAAAATRREPMRAILQSGYGATDVLCLGEAPRPTAGEGEVIVHVRAAGIDRGTWHLMTGRPYVMRVMGFGFRAPKSPVPGLDLAGTVVEVGPNVSRFRVGDVVFGLGQGSFAEYARAREDKLARVPGGSSLEEAAVLGVSGITALQALTDAGGLLPGERVLVIGASGGVGTYAAQLAKALGAEVTAVCSGAKVGRVRALGADHVIDYRARDFADGSERYDLILDIGGNAPLARLRKALAERGRLVFVGGEAGGDWLRGLGRPLGAALLGLFTRQRFVMMMAKEHYSLLERLRAFCEAGQVRPAIDRVIPLDDVPDALRDLEAGRVFGKVAVSLDARG